MSVHLDQHFDGITTSYYSICIPEKPKTLSTLTLDQLERARDFLYRFEPDHYIAAAISALDQSTSAMREDLRSFGVDPRNPVQYYCFMVGMRTAFARVVDFIDCEADLDDLDFNSDTKTFVGLLLNTVAMLAPDEITSGPDV